MQAGRGARLDILSACRLAEERASTRLGRQSACRLAEERASTCSLWSVVICLAAPSIGAAPAYINTLEADGAWS